MRLATSISISLETNPQVSTALCNPLSPQHPAFQLKIQGALAVRRLKKSHLHPVFKVYSFTFNNGYKFLGIVQFPDISMAFEGQASAHKPQSVHFSLSVIIPSGVKVSASSGQTSIQSCAPIHFEAVYNFCTCGDWLSGLWHHAHFSGQPFMKIVIRIPGPSLME